MAGDPKQLPPTLMSDGALDAQLDRTLFDRLQDSGAPPKPSLEPLTAWTPLPLGCRCVALKIGRALGEYMAEHARIGVSSGQLRKPS